VLRRYRTVLVSCLLLLCLPALARGERPPSIRLLPPETLLLLRVVDSQDLVDRLGRTAPGRIAQEEEMKPLVEEFTASVFRALASLEERSGVKAQDLLAMFDGEVTLAAVARSQAKPGFLLIGDLGEDQRPSRQLLEKLEETLTTAGGKKSTATVAGVSLTVLTIPKNSRDLMYFQKDDTLVVASSQDLVEDVLARWPGGAQETLAGNEKFATIMSRCRTDKEDAPQVMFFFDPIGMAQGAAYGNSRLQLTLALLPTVGLDGLKGIGGSITFATGNFDQITHFHVLLDNPRAGAIRLIALRTGEVEPEAWVPADISDYVTLHWDLSQTYESIASLMDSFQSEGAFARSLQERVGRLIDVNAERDLIGALEGRATFVTWYERPPRVGGRARLWALKLKDPDRFQETLARIADGKLLKFVRRGYSGYTYYEQPPRGEPAGGGKAVYTNQYCLAILDDYFIIADRPSSLHKIISVKEGAGDTLAQSIEYKLIASKSQRMIRGTQPSMLMFNRPEESVRYLYEIGGSDEALSSLATEARRYDVLKPVHETLSNVKLPPYSLLEKYLAPGGGVIVDDETGVHFIGFTLRRE